MEFGNLRQYQQIAGNNIMDKKIISILVLSSISLALVLTSVNASVFGDGVGINVSGSDSNSTMNDSIINRTFIGRVAYIVKNSNFVDENIEIYLDNKNLEVDIITDRKIPMTNFEDYDIIFVGKGKLQNIKDIPKYKNLILASNFHANYFGFVKDRVSRYGANTPLKVIYNDESVQVYDKSSFKLGSTSIPYYFLSNENLNDNVMSVAKAYKGGSHYLGDVVAYIEENNSIRNSSVKRCFYGIIETKYWENDAESLFDDCLDFTLGKFNHDVKIDETSSDGVNGIMIKDLSSNDFIMENPAILNCEETYMISAEVINTGDFSEKVIFHAMMSDIHLVDTKIINSDSKKLFSENLDLNLQDGVYTLNVMAEIKNSIDSNLGDNSRQRQINVVCESS